MLPSHGVRLKEIEAVTIKDELDEFQRNVAIHVARFKNAITMGERAVADDTRTAKNCNQRRRQSKPTWLIGIKQNCSV